MNTGILYIVATPIGNLEDITFRAIRVLSEVDMVVCEDTRVTRKLLEHYNITTSIASFYNLQRKVNATKPAPKIEYLIHSLKQGKSIALVTDAGTPGISDPGNQLVEAAVAEQISVIPVPGASAITALASVSGIDLGRFVFLGFPPHKKGRETFFKEVIELGMPVMYYESPYRVIKNLELLQKLGTEKRMIVGREMTKMFEEIVRGSVEEVLKYFEENKDKVKGEFVIIVY